MNGHSKKASITISFLLLIGLGSTVLNGVLTQENLMQSESVRILASVSPEMRRSPELVKWESVVAAQLNNNQMGVSATKADQPSPLDQLLYGRLEGSYAVQLRDGKVLGLRFLGGKEGVIAKRPYTVQDRASFIREIAGVLPVSFEQVQRTAATGSKEEIYDLLDSEHRSKGQVKMEIDSLSRLQSLSIMDHNFSSVKK